MRARPDGVTTEDIVEALAAGWGIAGAVAAYAPVGAGSYHWIVTRADGGHAFATVDDLDHKAWLGDARDTVFTGLTSAFDTATTLAEAGLAFVVGPVRARDGRTVLRLGERHTLALFPFVDGRAGAVGDHPPEDRPEVVRMLARLHAAAAPGNVRETGFELPGREHVAAGVRDLDLPWTGGPYSEPARKALAGGVAALGAFVAEADRLAGAAAPRSGPPVVTHGEPHTANVMRTRTGLVLVDWYTAAHGPPERDMWMLADAAGDDSASLYTELTGRALDQDALEFFRIAWDLRDLAEYLQLLRSPHGDDADTARAYEGVQECVAAAVALGSPRA
jgi:spectinomycin phosphotransferase